MQQTNRRVEIGQNARGTVYAWGPVARWKRQPGLAGCLLLWMAVTTSAVDPESAGARINYRDHIRPIFAKHCFSCHGTAGGKADLDLTRYSSTLVGGSSGKVLVSEDPAQSRLYLLVTHVEQPNMPRSQPRLPRGDLVRIRRWIEDGLRATATSQPLQGTTTRSVLSLDLPPVRRPTGVPHLPRKVTLQPAQATSRSNSVIALAGSPWAPLIAVGRPHQVVFFDAEKRQAIGSLPFPEGLPHLLKFTADGQRLLAAGGSAGISGRVVVWNVVTGKREVEVGQAEDVILAADINHNRTQVAVGDDRLLKIYRLPDTQLMATVDRHTDWIFTVAYSPDGAQLAVADRAGGLTVWDTHRWVALENLKGHRGAVTSLAWRRDGRVLASAGEDGTIRLWDVSRGQRVRTWSAHDQGVLCVTFGRRGELVSVGRDQNVRTWDPTGSLLDTLEPAFSDVATRVALFGEGERVVAGDWTGRLRVWPTRESKGQDLFP